MRGRRRGWVVLWAVVALLAAGCAHSEPRVVAGLTADATADELSRAFGAGCTDPHTHYDFAPAMPFVTSAEHWFEVEPGATYPSGAGEANVGLTVPMAEVTSIDDHAGSFQPRPTSVHPSLLPPGRWAAATPGARFFLALARGGFTHEMALFGVIVTDTAVAIVGECSRVSLQEPLVQSLGADRFATVMRKLIGSTGAKAQEAFPPPPTTVPKPNITVLNPATAPRELLATLALIGVRFVVPADWAGPFTVCTKIAEGWNDCAPLSSNRPASLDVSAYIGASDLEVWLMDDGANLERPIQLLATLPVPDEWRATRPKVVLRLGGTLTATGVEEPTVTVGPP